MGRHSKAILVLMWFSIFGATFQQQKAFAEPQVALTVDVRDQSGAVIAGAQVKLTKGPEDQGVAAPADSAGTVSLQVPAASYQLSVSSPGFRTETKQLDLVNSTQQKVVIVLRVGGCPVPDPCPVVVGTPVSMAFRLGQVWIMDLGITVTILATEDINKVGKVVHVRLDNIPWQSCGTFHLTRAIEHIAISEQMLVNSGLVLSQENGGLPQSSVEAYRRWRSQKKHEIVRTPLPVLIRSQSSVPGPMICNILPNQT